MVASFLSQYLLGQILDQGFARIYSIAQNAMQWYTVVLGVMQYLG